MDYIRIRYLQNTLANQLKCLFIANNFYYCWSRLQRRQKLRLDRNIVEIQISLKSSLLISKSLRMYYVYMFEFVLLLIFARLIIAGLFLREMKYKRVDFRNIEIINIIQRCNRCIIFFPYIYIYMCVSQIKKIFSLNKNTLNDNNHAYFNYIFILHF